MMFRKKYIYARSFVYKAVHMLMTSRILYIIYWHWESSFKSAIIDFVESITVFKLQVLVNIYIS